MIELIDGLPENILGLRVSGTLTAEDYDSVITPAVESRLARFSKLRLLCVVQDDFAGFSVGAAWRDAQLGMKHFTDFERVAAVTNKEWIDTLMRVFGFLVPGETETFRLQRYEEAKAWICEPVLPGKLEYRFDRETGVLVLEPHGALKASDFVQVAGEIDAYIAEKGALTGLVIAADVFPGWDNLIAMTTHFQFVREHASKVHRVAVITSDRFLAALPRLASIFVAAEVRHFPPEQRDAAMGWVAGRTVADA